MAGISPHIAEQVTLFVQQPDTNQDQVVKEISRSICARETRVEQLVSSLGSHLTSEAENERGRAALLLGRVLQQSPDGLQSHNTQCHIAAFLSSRLSDRPSLSGCLHGLNGLLSVQGLQLKQQEILAVSSAMLELDVPGLGQADRMLALSVLLQLLQTLGPQLVKLEVDILEGTIAAIDGEKDPRCLLLAFQCSQLVTNIYETVAPEVPAAQKSLDANLEELFDVVACYFPISFSPPPNNVHGITRQDLADALQRTLTCTPLVAPLFIPMLVEKLSSSLRQAKLDALAALPAAAAGFGGAAMKPHLSLIWRTLKPELFSAAAAAGSSDEQQAAQQIAAKAAECLTRMTAALAADSSNALPELVLADEQVVGDMLCCLSGHKQQGYQNADAQVQAAGSTIAALTAGSVAACKLVCSQLLPELLSVIFEDQYPHAQACHGAASALKIVQQVLQAALQLVAAGKCQQDPIAGWGTRLLAGVVQKASAASDCDAAGFDNGATTTDHVMQDQSLTQLAGSDDSDRMDDQDGHQCQAAVQLLQLEVLTELAAFPAELAVLSQQDIGDAVQFCLQYVLGQQAQCEQATAQQAIAALTKMAGADHSALLMSQALPPLLTAATAIEEQSGQWQGALPLAALTALCTSSSHLRQPILHSMQQLLPALLAAAVGSNQHEQMLLGVLHMLRGQLQASAVPDSMLASDVARHLLTGVLQLSKAGQAVSRSLATACTQAMQAATASCTAQQQAQHAQLACSQLHECCAQLQSTPQLPPHAHDDEQDRHQDTGDVNTLLQNVDFSQQHSNEQTHQQQQQDLMVADLHTVDLQHQLVEQSSMLAAATVAGLWPETLQEPGHVLQCLLCLVVGLRCTEAQQAAMVAAAAVLNRWPAGDAASLQTAIAQAHSLLHLTPHFLQPVAEPQTFPRPASFTCLAWLVKGMYMAGHVAAFDLAMLPLDYFTSRHATAAQPAQEHHQHGIIAVTDTTTASDTHTQHILPEEGQSSELSSTAAIQAAAASLYQLVPASQFSILSLDKGLGHTTQKLLWQQRFFTQSLQQLEKLLNGATDPVTTNSASTSVLLINDQQPQTNQSGSGQAVQQEHLLVALAHLVKGTPAHIVKTALPGLAGLLLQGLAVLQQPGYSTDSSLLLGVLKTVDSVMKDATGQQALESEVGLVMSSLVNLVQFTGSAEVRVVSMQCLAATLKMSYHLLHPYKKQVVAALAAAIDDNKRQVRLEAVKCRKAWVSG